MVKSEMEGYDVTDTGSMTSDATHQFGYLQIVVHYKATMKIPCFVV